MNTFRRMNPNPLEKIIPCNLLKEGIYLLPVLGANEYAWDKDNIEKIIKILFDRKIGILGGDVYKISDGKIEMTLDNWYYDDDGSADFYLRSQEKTLNYIYEYEKKCKGSFLYSLVILD